MIETILDGVQYVIWGVCISFMGATFWFSIKVLWKMYQLVRADIEAEGTQFYKHEGD